MTSASGPTDHELLRRFRPCLRYDSQATFKALSAASMMDNPGNELRRGKAVVATAGQEPPLALKALTKSKAKRRDRLHRAPRAAEHAFRLQNDSRYAGVVHGAVRQRGQRRYLQYWLWFYAVGPFPSARKARCGWRLVQVELDEAGNPTHVAAGGPSYERRAWASVDKRRIGSRRHPVVYVDPRLQSISLEAEPHGTRLGWHACDGGGPLVVSEVELCAGWAAWPGRWGSFRGAPRSPGRTWQWRRPHRVGRAGPRSLLRAVVGGLRQFAARSVKPAAPELTARLERNRVVVRWQRADERELFLLLTVHDEHGAPVAARYALADEDSGEEVIALSEPHKQCELRTSAGANFQRTECRRQPLTLHHFDELEATIFDRIVSEQLASKETRDFARRFRVHVRDLRKRQSEDIGSIWHDVASELQAFRDARSAQSLRRLSDARRSRARRTFTALGVVSVVVAVATIVVAILGGDQNLTMLTAYAGGLALYLCGLIGLSRWLRWRMVRGEAGGLPAAADDGAYETAREAFERALREKWVAPFIREQINAGTVDSYSQRLDFGDEGLAEHLAIAHEIQTDASKRLAALADRMHGGSIGIAGPRGAGKSTLIRAFCTPKSVEDRRLTTIIAAPARYDARDFVLTLFARLCETVLAGERHPVAQGVPRLLVRIAPLAPVLPAALIVGILTWRAFAWDASWPTFVAIALLALAVVTTGLEQLGGRQPRSYRLLLGSAVAAAALVLLAAAHTHWYDSYRVADWAAVIAGGAAYAASLWRRPLPGPRRLGVSDDALVNQAAEQLRDIRFQQSFSTGYAGKLRLPAGAELSMDRREELAQRQASFPEIVDRLREFIALAARARGGVVIGIDEMDKMESADVAQQFLNEIKGIFGVERCVYLVSISEDAMASFERRGLPFRDVFDSSFDEVLTVGPLTLEQSQLLLRRRILGLGPAYLDLCHCLAGGLARDVLRVARQLSLQKPSGRGKPALKTVVATIVAAELTRKINAISVSAHRISLEPHVTELLRWISALPPMVGALERGSTDASDLLGWCESLPANWPRELPSDGDARTLERMQVELAAFAYFIATVLELFVRVDGDPVSHFRDAEAPDSGFDRLAVARAAFSVNPLLAVEIVNRVRKPGWQRLSFVPVERSGDRGSVTAIPRRQGPELAASEA
jgi:hypothetical protein